MPRNKKKEQDHTKNVLLIITIAVIAFSISIIIAHVFKPTITGAETAYANVTINQSVGILLITDGTNFTSAGPNDYRESNTSTDTLPSNTRINISNNGNRPVNISLQTTTNLFTSVDPVTDSSYKCMVEICNGRPASAATGAGSAGDDAGECEKSPWNETYTDCDSGAGTVSDVIGNLSFWDGTDTAVLDISITVPTQESGGPKQSTMSLVATDSGS